MIPDAIKTLQMDSIDVEQILMKLETNIAVFGVWTLRQLFVYAWHMYDMQTLHAGGIPMFRGTYLVCFDLDLHLTCFCFVYVHQHAQPQIAGAGHPCYDRSLLFRPNRGT